MTPPRERKGDCVLNGLSSRVCERGTKCCDVRHETPPRPLRQVLEELAIEWEADARLYDGVHAYKQCSAQLREALSSLDREEPARVATLEAALREVREEHDGRPFRGVRGPRCYIDMEFGDLRCDRCQRLDALTVSSSSGREQG